MGRRITTEEFIQKAKEVHGDRYDYSKTVYSTAKTKITITCKKHGDFEQIPDNHLKGKTCIKCSYETGRKKCKTTSQFIKEAKEVHGDKYDYSLTEYIRNDLPVIINCTEHGMFEQLPKIHLKGSGCSVCGADNSISNRRITTEEFIQKAKEVHGDRYDYSKTVYENYHHKIWIVCKSHGKFVQSPANHLAGNNCPKCSVAERIKKQSLTTEEFIQNAKEVHGDKYDYTNTYYNGSKELISITCKKHGIFEQQAGNHLAGKGCNGCRTNNSQPEKDIMTFLHDLNFETISNNRTIISPFELDIVIPEKKLAIEYCGLYWHSEKFVDKLYHTRKLELCNKAGYRLITIFEDEWLFKKEFVLSKLKHILGVNTEAKVYARKTKIVQITKEQRMELLIDNHIQGDGSGSVNLGLEYNGDIVAAITFKKGTDNTYDLNRYATICNVVGGFSKLLTYFKRNYEWKTIHTFADRRWSEGNVYLKNGFEHVYNTQPNYFYSKDGKIRESRNKYMRHKLESKLEIFDPDLTEVENMHLNKFYRIFDCGNMKFVLENK